MQPSSQTIGPAPPAQQPGRPAQGKPPKPADEKEGFFKRVLAGSGKAADKLADKGQHIMNQLKPGSHKAPQSGQHCFTDASY